jgi:hypothetical protein
MHVRRIAQLLWHQLYPESTTLFVFSHGWFWWFLRRAGIVRRRVTKAAFKAPDQLTRTVNSFIQFVRKHSRRQGSFQATMLRSSPPIATGLADGLLLPPKKLFFRRYPPKLILNVDETPLPFEFLSGYTYDWKGVTTVAGKSDRSGWDKRQAIIVLHIMANGNIPFKPILIFHG